MNIENVAHDIANFWGNAFKTYHAQQTSLVSSFFDTITPCNPDCFFPLSSSSLEDLYVKTSQAIITNPSGLLKAHGELIEEMNCLWQKLLSLGAMEKTDSLTDKRFRHSAWETVPYFLFIKEYYLILSHWLEKLVSQLDDLDADSSQKVQFYAKQLIDALSPTNSPFTNPEVLEEFIKTKGESLKKGLTTFLQDMEVGQGMKMTDPSAFQIGKTLASTKGEVVFRNHIFELIHYAPLTEKQYKIPLLIIPPWINRYYIFDLSDSNSFVKWMVEQGQNVFIISWVNPGPELSKMTFEDYLLEGAYRACEVVSSLAKSPHLHTMGYCIGGNLLTALGAYLAKTPAPFSLKTMTLLATVIDFEKIGDLKIFLEEEHLQSIEKIMDQQGFLPGEYLKSLFNLLRPNDLVWSFFIKNYLLGQVPPAFDFLYWNSHSTRLPKRLHQFILRKFFKENLLYSGGISVGNVPIDLRNITTPTFFLSTIEDHISPWKSTYPALHLFQGPLKFVLAGSGHVVGVINPPANNKYGFFTNPHVPFDPDTWIQSATKTEGSWWTEWLEWVVSYGNETIEPLTTYPFIEAAPGSYVRAG